MGATEYKSPITISIVIRLVDGDRCHLLEVEMDSTGEILASCMVSDDANVQRIADLLSEKGLKREAMAFRNLARQEGRVTGL